MVSEQKNKSLKPSILIVDDDETMCVLLKCYLAQEFRIKYECDPRRVLPLLHKIQLDLILTDIYMPHINGIELLKIITKNVPSIPVALMSGNANSDSLVEIGFQNGAISFFPKPFISPQEARGYINNALNKANAGVK